MWILFPTEYYQATRAYRDIVADLYPWYVRAQRLLAVEIVGCGRPPQFRSEPSFWRLLRKTSHTENQAWDLYDPNSGMRSRKYIIEQQFIRWLPYNSSNNIIQILEFQKKLWHPAFRFIALRVRPALPDHLGGSQISFGMPSLLWHSLGLSGTVWGQQHSLLWLLWFLKLTTRFSVVTGYKHVDLIPNRLITSICRSIEHFSCCQIFARSSRKARICRSVPE